MSVWLLLYSLSNIICRILVKMKNSIQKKLKRGLQRKLLEWSERLLDKALFEFLKFFWLRKCFECSWFTASELNVSSTRNLTHFLNPQERHSELISSLEQERRNGRLIIWQRAKDNRGKWRGAGGEFYSAEAKWWVAGGRRKTRPEVITLRPSQLNTGSQRCNVRDRNLVPQASWRNSAFPPHAGEHAWFQRDCRVSRFLWSGETDVTERKAPFSREATAPSDEVAADLTQTSEATTSQGEKHRRSFVFLLWYGDKNNFKRIRRGKV